MTLRITCIGDMFQKGSRQNAPRTWSSSLRSSSQVRVSFLATLEILRISIKFCFTKLAQICSLMNIITKSFFSALNVYCELLSFWERMSVCGMYFILYLTEMALETLKTSDIFIFVKKGNKIVQLIHNLLPYNDNFINIHI